MADVTDADLEEFRRAIRRSFPDSPRYTRVRYSGGSENRAGEVTGRSRNEETFHAAEEPHTRRFERRELGAEDEQFDLNLIVLDVGFLEQGDRVEDDEGIPYKVDSRQPIEVQGEPLADRVGLTRQES